jgi:hypothetical protein
VENPSGGKMQIGKTIVLTYTEASFQQMTSKAND